jgi:cation diffusion facilitator CzcD-associated flavoprotein CzcO
MSFSQEDIPAVRSEWSIQRHGDDTPFRHHSVIRQYVENLFITKGYGGLVEFGTTVERAVKDEDGKWVLALRRTEVDSVDGSKSDYWWEEVFDAVIVASGHYAVPYIPAIPGLKEFAGRYPGSVEHTKHYRGPEKYIGKVCSRLIPLLYLEFWFADFFSQKVITVGASVSAADTAVSLIDSAQTPVIAVVRGRYNMYFGDEAFQHPKIQRRAPISHITSENGNKTVYFEDGTTETGVDHIIFGTGFSWTLPFLPQVATRNNRVPDLYQHVFYRHDPTLVFVGAVSFRLPQPLD